MRSRAADGICQPQDWPLLSLARKRNKEEERGCGRNLEETRGEQYYTRPSQAQCVVVQSGTTQSR